MEKPVRNSRKRKPIGGDPNEDVTPKKKRVAKTAIEKVPLKRIKKVTDEPKKKVTKAKASAQDVNKDTIQENVSNSVFENACLWDESEMLSRVERIPVKLAQNFIALLTEGCTLPFIARYRKTVVDHLMPDRLQDLFDSYQNISQLKKKVKSVIETLKKSKKLTPEYSPLKSHVLSLAEKARNLGLEPYAIQALNGGYININELCSNDEELSTPEKVDTHVTHIVADIIYKDARVLEQMRNIKTSTKDKKETDNKIIDKKSDPETYKIYFDWKCPSHFVKPHQTLALNRGEDEKVLSVKVVVPDWFHNKLESDAYNRLIKPWLSRQVRSDLTIMAQKEAVKTFITNLEKYLLTEPIKNRVIAGLDPGFKAGCKLGIINANGDKLETCTLYPDLRRNNHNDTAARQLKELLACRETETWLKFHHISENIPVIIVPEQGASVYSISKEAQKVTVIVELIGLGNGTACRETETWLKFHHISENIPVTIVTEIVELIGLFNGTACRETETWLKFHHISENIPVIIVPEQGASIYSISKRVLDPLGELIKVEPKNLGVGMYQHDIPPKMLETALGSAVEKVVSLVGVDINTASQAMLRRISGLNDGRAKKLIAYRQDNGSFTTRAEILKVSGIGKVTFQQCAGFLKRVTVSIDVLVMSRDLGTDACTLELIINAFKQKTHEDNIISYCRPVYSVTVQATDQIREGMCGPERGPVWLFRGLRRGRQRAHTPEQPRRQPDPQARGPGG
ncbi:putative S1 RNA binding domain protein, partial [Operophtera brumata]